MIVVPAKVTFVNGKLAPSCVFMMFTIAIQQIAMDMVNVRLMVNVFVKSHGQDHSAPSKNAMVPNVLTMSTLPLVSNLNCCNIQCSITVKTWKFDDN